MNIQNLQLLLQQAINDSTETIDYLILSKALESLELGQMRTVNSFANLPSAAANEGLLVWVAADERLYWSTGLDWFPIIQNSENLAWAWGGNGDGQLGDGTTTNQSSPVSVVGGFTDWCAVAGGSGHSLGIRTNGTAWAWGSNSQGRLGDGTTTNQSSPVSVVGGFTDWCDVSASGHSLGIRANGTAWAWGFNGNGRLGDGTTIGRSSPVSVVGGFTDWCDVSAGQTHSLGIRTNGTIWSWGCNGFGQVGDGTITSRTSPVSVVGGFTDWCGVSAGSLHTLGIRANGTVWAWGLNSFGALGDNTTTDRSSPVSVVGGFTDWCGVGAGSHSLGIRVNGTVWAWGLNTSGQLGDNTTTDRSSPVSVVGGFTDWCGVSAGSQHSLGIRANGTAWAWGYNGTGRLGDGTTTDRSSPVSVVGSFTDWCGVSAGQTHSLGIRRTDFT
jgi:alpha-tubulin suppressor-like RCC1 family protein